jgi:multiple sugar transport system substrate-binding protein
MDRNQTVKFKTALRGQKKLLVVATSILALMFSGVAPVQAQTTITVWHYFSGNPSQEKLMADFKEMAEKADTRIKVENVYVPYDQMNSKIVAAAITNSGPDVMVFTGTTTDELVAAGALASMEPYWSTLRWSIKLMD